METTTKKLIQTVDDQRTQRRMSDRKFSMSILGISPSYWCLLKAGKKPLTPNLAVRFMQKLPTIAPQVTIFIMRQGNDGENQETPHKTSGENPALGQLCTPTGRKSKKT